MHFIMRRSQDGKRTELFKLIFVQLPFTHDKRKSEERGEDEREKLVEHRGMVGKSLEHNNSIELCFTTTYPMEKQIIFIKRFLGEGDGVG
jgi:hypothetical protein